MVTLFKGRALRFKAQCMTYIKLINFSSLSYYALQCWTKMNEELDLNVIQWANSGVSYI